MQTQIQYTNKTIDIMSLIKHSFGIKKVASESSGRIEKATDNFGNEIIASGGLIHGFGYCKTSIAVPSGQYIRFHVDALHPEGLMVEYSLDIDYKNVVPWQRDPDLSVKMRNEDISKFCQVRIKIRSVNKYNIPSKVENSVIFSYQVTPGL
jgi:hypothetical protein